MFTDDCSIPGEGTPTTPSNNESEEGRGLIQQIGLDSHCERSENKTHYIRQWRGGGVVGGLGVFFHAFLCTLEESGRVSKSHSRWFL